MINAYGMARLGRDAELRYTGNGDAVCNLSLAFNYGKRDQNGQRPTTWVDGSLWGKRAEALAPYLLKGAPIMVALEELHIEFYQARDGGERGKLVARVADIELGGSREQAPDEPGANSYSAPQRQATPAAPPARAPLPAGGRVAAPPRVPARAAPPAGAPGSSGSGFDDFDSDIPF